MKEPKIVKLTLENGATVTVPNGMTIAAALKLAEELERKEEVHEPEAGDVYQTTGGNLIVIVGHGKYTHLSETYFGSTYDMKTCELNADTVNTAIYLGKFWEVFGLKSDHQKEMDELQAKYDKSVTERLSLIIKYDDLALTKEDVVVKEEPRMVSVDEVREILSIEDKDGDSYLKYLITNRMPVLTVTEAKMSERLREIGVIKDSE